MDGPQLFNLYNTMVLPHLQYCLINWGNFEGECNRGLRDRLITLQKCFVRIISGAHRKSHSKPLFANLETLRVDDMFTHSVRVFSYQLWKGLLPSEMASFVKEIDHGHSTRGAKSNFYVGNSCLKSIRSIAPSYWNPLSMEMKLSPSVASFKERSKRDLLGPYASFSCRVRDCYPCSVSSGHS